MWTIFWDMHSGGGTKLSFEKCYIEAPANIAKEIFYQLFDRDPDNVTCDCCGNDYSISQYNSLEEASEFHRRGISLEEYSNLPDVKIIGREQLLKDMLDE